LRKKERKPFNRIFLSGSKKRKKPKRRGSFRELILSSGLKEQSGGFVKRKALRSNRTATKRDQQETEGIFKRR
jgi:hypothetical protein